jgi:cytochrome c556
MSYLKSRNLFAAITLAFTSPLLAGGDPVHERHELMEGVGDAAKPIGQMLKGERDFDAGVVMASFKTFDEASAQFGKLWRSGVTPSMRPSPPIPRRSRKRSRWQGRYSTPARAVTTIIESKTNKRLTARLGETGG